MVLLSTAPLHWSTLATCIVGLLYYRQRRQTRTHQELVLPLTGLGHLLADYFPNGGQL